MIILEGPNGAGKTTEAYKLSKILNWGYHYNRERETRERLFARSEDQVSTRKRIVDRNWISEAVYRVIEHRSVRFSIEELYYLSLLSLRGTTWIIVPDFETISNRVDYPIKGIGKLDHKLVHKIYSEGLKSKVELIDGRTVRILDFVPFKMTTTGIPNEESRRVISMLALNQSKLWDIYECMGGSGIGAISPEILFLTDNDRLNGEGSLSNLLRDIYRVGLGPDQVHILNYSGRGVHGLHECIKQLNPRLVVLCSELNINNYLNYYKYTGKAEICDHVILGSTKDPEIKVKEIQDAVKHRCIPTPISKR